MSDNKPNTNAYRQHLRSRCRTIKVRPACLHVRAHIYCLKIRIRKDTDCLYEIVFGDNIQRNEAQRNRAGGGLATSEMQSVR